MNKGILKVMCVLLLFLTRKMSEKWHAQKRKQRSSLLFWGQNFLNPIVHIMQNKSFYVYGLLILQ